MLPGRGPPERPLQPGRSSAFSDAVWPTVSTVIEASKLNRRGQSYSTTMCPEGDLAIRHEEGRRRQAEEGMHEKRYMHYSITASSIRDAGAMPMAIDHAAVLLCHLPFLRQSAVVS
jgi:hypothetical protein